MKTFPESAFLPCPGELNQLITENPDRGVKPHLQLSLSIPFEPFELEDEDVSTALWLSGIQLEATSWMQFAGKTADVTLVDGTVNLFDAHNPVEVHLVQFGALQGREIPVSLEATIDLESQGNDEYANLPLKLTTNLAISPLKVATSLAKRLKNDASDISAALEGKVDLSDYGDLEKAPGGVVFPLK